MGPSACPLSDDTRDGQCPHLRRAGLVQDARRRIQCGPGGYHIIDQYYGLASNFGNGSDGKGTSQISLVGQKYGRDYGLDVKSQVDERGWVMVRIDQSRVILFGLAES